jgi:hypothetical protein
MVARGVHAGRSSTSPRLHALTSGDPKGPPIGINRNPNPGFRRGEGGWVDAGRAFRLCWRMTQGACQGTRKGHPYHDTAWQARPCHGRGAPAP